jgi:hypothetical protein
MTRAGLAFAPHTAGQRPTLPTTLAAEPADFQVVGSMSHSIFKNEAMHDVGGPKRLPTHQDRPAPH